MKIRVERLEIHAAHACNLTCESCSHYSNHGHAGFMSPEEADVEMGRWSGRLQPALFNILGGEPTINPRLTEFVAVAARHWPQICVVSNGFFLHRHPELGAMLGKVHGKLALSQHGQYPAFDGFVALAQRWQREHGFSLEVRRYVPGHAWTRRYEGYGATMMPFTDGNQRASWEICPAKSCLQLHAGKLWKCGPLAYLPMQKARWPELSSAWDPYLSYVPLDPAATDEELRRFVRRQDEAMCTMCSGVPRPIVNDVRPDVRPRDLLRKRA